VNMRPTTEGWFIRFKGTFVMYTILSFFMIVINGVIDKYLKHQDFPFSWDMLYLMPITCIFGGVFFASFFSLFPGVTE